jgi:restriction system protein
MTETSKPTLVDLMWPALVALKDLGGSSGNAEMLQKVIEYGGYTEAQQSEISSDGRRTLIDYRLHWARTYLKNLGLIDNSSKGIWTLTKKRGFLFRKCTAWPIERMAKGFKTRL